MLQTDAAVSPTTVRVVIFDLGGVLIEQDHAVLADALGPAVSPSAWKHWMLDAPVARAFECGTCTAVDFARGAIAHFELQCGHERFLRAFTNWVHAPYPASRQLVHRVRSDLATAILSNCNELHLGRLTGFGVPTWVDRCYFSHLLRMAKPDPGVFRAVTDDLGLGPSSVLFLDDNLANVQAARDAGWGAHQVLGPQEAHGVLDAAGLLAAGDSPGAPAS